MTRYAGCCRVIVSCIIVAKLSTLLASFLHIVCVRIVY